MVRVREFEEFFAAKTAEMVLEKSWARGRGFTPSDSAPRRSGGASGPIGASRAGTPGVEGRPGNMDDQGLNAASQQPPDGSPLEGQGTDADDRREGNTVPDNAAREGDDARERDGTIPARDVELPSNVNTSQTSGGTVPPPPRNSTFHGAGHAAPQLANAFQELFTSENRDDALAQLLANLVIAQQPPPQSVTLIPTFHVMPDLSKNIEDFTGDDDSVRARDWIENLEAMQRLHKWPDEFLFEAARTHLKSGARDWERSRVTELKTWREFRAAFRETFIMRDDLSTRWARMKARVQEKGESLTRYFHAKERMCNSLTLSFREGKAEILIGLWSRELCNAAMAATQYTYDELLHDLVYYEKLINQRGERIRSMRDSGSTGANHEQRRRVAREINQRVRTTRVHHAKSRRQTDVLLIVHESVIIATSKDICHETVRTPYVTLSVISAANSDTLAGTALRVEQRAAAQCRQSDRRVTVPRQSTSK